MEKIKWKSPNTVTGPVAKGKNFFERQQIVEDIWYELENGSFILLAAPRRVGKTSIMTFLASKPKEGYKLIFRNVQGISSEKDFYKTIYELIINCLSKSNQFKKWVEIHLKSRSISEVDINGKLKLTNIELDYLAEINDIIPKIESDGEIVVLFIDELPELLFNLHKNNQSEDASRILKNLRRWRQEEQFEKLRFVLAGSIGIHYVVNTIEGRNSDLNDLKEVTCLPIEDTETDKYFDWATNNSTVQYNPELRAYLLSKIQYFVPYFINLMLNEIDNVARKRNNPTISKTDIDAAFASILNNNDFFADWKKRLSNYMPPADYIFVNEILTHIAHRESLTIQQIYDIAAKHDKMTDFMDFIDNLKKDGYIINRNNVYVFISPFIKEFWKLKNPIYNV
jgi:hypothetical protein